MSQTNLRAKITLEATVSPSEDAGKVVGAIEKLMGGSAGEVSLGSRAVKFVTHEQRALLRFRDQLRDRHVRSAARRRLLLGRNGNLTTLLLNRQAAAAGVLVICGSPEESPMGPIYMTIESKELDRVTDFLTSY
jgi:predicted RNA binding protein with dsRBD fold (UPF0201 family)